MVYRTRNRSAIGQALGALEVDDGSRFVGSILAQSGRYVAYDSHGHSIGTFDRERLGTTALYQASRPGARP